MLRLAILMVSKGIPVGNARNASLYNRLLLTFMDLTVKTFYKFPIIFNWMAYGNFSLTYPVRMSAQKTRDFAGLESFYSLLQHPYFRPLCCQLFRPIISTDCIRHSLGTRIVTGWSLLLFYSHPYCWPETTKR